MDKVLSEQNLITSFVRWFDNKSNKQIIVPMGDDSFVGKLLPKHNQLVITNDLLVEDTHFKLSWQKFVDKQIGSFWTLFGQKLININISDLAAMGDVIPLFGIISLGLPKIFSFHSIRHIVSGIKTAACDYNIAIVGGDTVRSTKIFCGLTLIGCTNKKPLTRTGVKNNDWIFVSDPLGDAAAGLEILEAKSKNVCTFDNPEKDEIFLLNQFVNPIAKVKFAKTLASHKLVNSLTDISDGLSVTIDYMCKSNSLGAEIWVENIPVSKQLKSWTSENNECLEKYVVHGGEDYALLFTVSDTDLVKFINFYPKFKPIGKFNSSKKVVYKLNSKKISVPGYGYDAFL